MLEQNVLAISNKRQQSCEQILPESVLNFISELRGKTGPAKNKWKQCGE
jgi:hypothetical protein